MSRHVSGFLCVERDGCEIECEIRGDYYAGYPGCFYRSNGDPGDPPEPAEVEDITAIDLATKLAVELTDDEAEKAREKLLETMSEMESD